jgi:hypothetical protein
MGHRHDVRLTVDGDGDSGDLVLEQVAETLGLVELDQ